MTDYTTDYETLHRYSTASIPISGTSMSLEYNCRRTVGRKADRKLEVPLFGDDPPLWVEKVFVDVEVAGKVMKETYFPEENLTHEVVWDGRDANGNFINGSHPVDIDLEYRWQGKYGAPKEEVKAFANSSDSTYDEIVSRAKGSSKLSYDGRADDMFLSVIDYRRAGLGGWSLSENHRYDSNQGVLYRGDGNSRTVRTAVQEPTISVAAGKDYDERLYNPAGLTIGPDESVYVADYNNNAIKRFRQNGAATTVVGTGFGVGDSSVQRTLVEDAGLDNPVCGRIGPDGNLYVTDSDRNVIRRRNPNGSFEVVAGTPSAEGFQADEIPTENALLTNPTGMVFDDDGAILVAESENDVVRRIELDGTTSVVAGDGYPGYEGDGGPATEARLARPSWIAAGPDGGYYVADADNHAIRRFEVGGDIETVAGGNKDAKYHSKYDDGDTAVDANLSNPLGVDVGDDGSIYIAESGYHRVSKVDPDGTIERLAGGNGEGYTGTGGPATDAELDSPSGIAVAPDDSVYVSEWGNGVVRRIRPDGTIEFFNGWRPKDERSGASERPLGEDDDAVDLIDVAPDGTIYYSIDSYDPAIKRVTPDGDIEHVAGGDDDEHGGDGGPAVDATFGRVSDLCVTDDGMLYVADRRSRRVRKIDTDGIITTVAGTGDRPDEPSHGDGGPATEADLQSPDSIAVSDNDELFIAEENVVRRVDPDGTITTHLGGEDQQYGDVLNRDSGHMPDVYDVELAGDDNLYVHVDGSYSRSMILAERTAGVLEYATAPVNIEEYDRRTPAKRYPEIETMEVASDGTLFLAAENDIYRVSTDDTVSQIAGVGRVSYVGDGGPAKRAGLARPTNLATGPEDQLYVAEAQADVVRRIDVRLTGEARSLVPNKDGSEFYEFDTAGYHTRTFNTVSGEVVNTFEYDGVGLLTSVTDVDGETTTIERDDDGNPTAIVAPDGQRTNLEVNNDGYLDVVEAPTGDQASLSYGDGGLLTEYEAPSGRTVTFGYDELGNVETATTSSGTITLSETEADDVRTVTHESPLGRTITQEVTHGDDRRLVTESPSGAARTVIEHEDGSKTRVSRESDTVEQEPYEPDPRFGPAAGYVGNETRRTPQGLHSNVEIRRSARMTDDEDPSTLERLVETKTVDSRTSKYVADTSERELTETTPEGRAVTTTVDAAGRPTRIDPDGLAPTVVDRDDSGSVESVTVGTGSDEREYTHEYRNGFLWRTTNPEGHQLTLDRDAAGRITESTLPDGRVVDYDRDREGLLSSITSPGGSTHGFAYDGLDLDTVTLPDGSVVDYDFDADGNVSSVEYPGGDVLSYTYDDAGRTDEIDLGHGSITFTWDDAFDLAKTIDGPDGVSLDLEYDGSLVTKRTWSGGVSGVVGRTYDDSFRLDSRTVAGNTVTFDYDDDDNRTKAGALNIDLKSDTGLVDETTLDASVESWTYDEFGDVDTHDASVGGTTLYDADYTYDDRGVVEELTETVEGETTTREFRHDASGRLERVITDGTTTQEFGYDDDDNRTSHTRDGSTVTPTYDDRHRLKTYGDRTYDYTAAGHLQSVTENGDTTTYDYDVRHNLRSVTKPDGTAIEYLHDAFDRRVAKKVDGTITRKWLYRDGLNPVAELDGDDNLVAQFVYGTRDYVPDYVIKNGTNYRIVTDHLGSPRLVVDANSGDVEQRIDYDAFGRVTDDTNPGFQPFGFAGGLYDPDTGLVRHGARDYDPETGRWTTPDPLNVAGGSFNRYTYAGNGPLNLVDRTGLAIVTGMVIGAGVGMAFDAGMQYATKGHVDVGQTLVSGGVGAATGGAGGAMSAAGWGTVRSTIGGMAAGFFGGGAEQAGKNYIEGKCNVWDGVGDAAVINGVTGGLGGSAGGKVSDSVSDYANQIRHYNDVASEAGDVSTSQTLKPDVIEHAVDTGIEGTGKSIGAGLGSATSGPGGASK